MSKSQYNTFLMFLCMIMGELSGSNLWNWGALWFAVIATVYILVERD